MNKKRLEQLYLADQLSLSEVARKLNCSVKVVNWMNRFQIPRRNRNEAHYIKHNPNGDPFKIKKLETDREHMLFQIGIGLYIGEGTKDKNRVVLVNTNPRVIRTFLRFLREICEVEETRIYAYLNIFNDTDLSDALKYWQQVTHLPRSQFVKPTIRRSQGGSYRQKSRYETLTIGLSNTKLSEQIAKWCEDALDHFGS